MAHYKNKVKEQDALLGIEKEPRDKIVDVDNASAWFEMETANSNELSNVEIEAEETLVEETSEMAIFRFKLKRIPFTTTFKIKVT